MSKIKTFKIVGVFVFCIILVAIFVQFKFIFEQNRIYQTPAFEIESLVQKADIDLGKRLYTVRNGCIDSHGADFQEKLSLRIRQLDRFMAQI